MINWNKKPYSAEQFCAAWKDAVFTDDAARVLNVPLTTGSLTTLNRIADELGLAPKPAWNKDYSVEDFKSAWENSLTIQEVAMKLEASSARGFKKMAEHLGLTPKADDNLVSYSKESFISAWQDYEHLDEVATFLGVSTSKQSYAKLLQIARNLNLPAKKPRIHTTDTGEDTSAIMAEWIDWHNDHYKVAPLDTNIKIAARKVKELVTAKYTTVSIKWGLFQWTLAVHRGYMDPNIITSMTHKHYLDHNPDVAATAKALETANEVGDNGRARLGVATQQPPVIEAKKW